LFRKQLGVDADKRLPATEYQAAKPKVRSMKRNCPAVSPFASQRIWAFPDDVHGLVCRDCADKTDEFVRSPSA